MNKVKISIIVPVYNTEKYLPKCLDSIVNQTYKNLEIICVDDGSEDSSADILNRYAEQDARFVIINKENEGVSVARNKALETVSGEYIMFVDSDDWIDINTCELALNKALQQKADVVFWTYIREFLNVSLQKSIFDESEIIFGQKEIEDKLYRRAFGLIGKELSHPENADALCTIWGKLYKTSIVRDNEIYFYDIREIGTYEDGLFNLNIWSFVNKAVYMNMELFNWSKNNDRVIYTGQTNVVEQYLSAMDVYILPSYREGFGSGVIEAEAMGIPVIVSDIPGPTDAMEKNETGIVVKKADVESLKSAMSEIRNNENTRKYMSENAYVFAKENFEQQQLFKYILEDRKRLLGE